jgi:hypothetical protein
MNTMDAVALYEELIQAVNDWRMVNLNRNAAIEMRVRFPAACALPEVSYWLATHMGTRVAAKTLSHRALTSYKGSLSQLITDELNGLENEAVEKWSNERTS